MPYTLLPGDHISYGCGTHSHHGIYCGDISYKDRLYKEVVIHFEGKHKRGQIRGLAYHKFAQDREIYVLPYRKEVCFAPETVIRRAINRLGEPDYNLFGNNCEHFAHWCKTGKSTSDQVNNTVSVVGSTVVAGLVAALIPLSVPGAAAVGVGAAVGYLSKMATDLFMNSVDYEK